MDKRVLKGLAGLAPLAGLGTDDSPFDILQALVELVGAEMDDEGTVSLPQASLALGFKACSRSHPGLPASCTYVPTSAALQDDEEQPGARGRKRARPSAAAAAAAGEEDEEDEEEEKGGSEEESEEEGDDESHSSDGEPQEDEGMDLAVRGRWGGGAGAASAEWNGAQRRGQTCAERAVCVRPRLLAKRDDEVRCAAFLAVGEQPATAALQRLPVAAGWHAACPPTCISCLSA